MTGRNFIPRSLGAVLALLGGVSACGGNGDGDVIEVSGHVEASEVRIASKTPGRLQELFVDEGEAVTQGQVLAQIDTTDVHLAWLAARAARAEADAQLRLRRAGFRVEDIAAAKADADRAAAELTAAEKDLERMETLLDAGSATAKVRDDAQSRRDQARAGLEAAREQWQRLRRGSRVEEVELAVARLEAADAKLAQIRQQIDDARVVAPLSGRMTEKLAEPGELLTSGTPIAILTNLEEPWLTVYLGEPDLSHVALGQAVEVRTDGGEVRTGTLTYVSSEAEFTPRNVQTREERVKLVFEARVGLENPDGLWKPGMPAEARIPVQGERP